MTSGLVVTMMLCDLSCQSGIGGAGLHAPPYYSMFIMKVRLFRLA